jgi:hypothetical protein
MSEFSQLGLLQRLRQRQLGSAQQEKTSPLERIFLEHAALSPENTLYVTQPHWFALSDDKRSHWNQARERLSLPKQDAPVISLLGAPVLDGACEEAADAVIILSAEQSNASLGCRENAFILPALAELYAQRAQLIREFTIREPLVGTITYRLGDTPLDKLADPHAHPKPGSYNATIGLETPHGSVSALRAFANELAAMVEDPEALAILDPLTFGSLLERGTALRQRLGALGRYSAKNHGPVTTTLPSIVTRVNGTQYHFATADKNIILYDGENPYPALLENDGFALASIADADECIELLVRAELLTPSEPVLRERGALIDSLAQRLEQQGVDPLAVEELRRGQADLNRLSYAVRTQSPQRAIATIQNQAPALLEYALVPAVDDVTLHLVLPRLYTRPGLGSYHSTNKFISEFSAQSTEERLNTLRAISSQTHFYHEQNPDANRWLKTYHADECAAANIKFEAP